MTLVKGSTKDYLNAGICPQTRASPLLKTLLSSTEALLFLLWLLEFGSVSRIQSHHLPSLMFATVTGTSTGIGRNMAELLLSKGDIVVATARKPEVLNDLKARYPPSQLLTLKLDVDSTQEIKDAFTQAKAAFGRIDVVFNNAGWLILGEIEATPEEEARKLFQTNFWGATNVSREAVKFFREDNKPSGGLLITNSSVVGVAAFPGCGYYVATKHGKFDLFAHAWSCF